MAADLAAAVLRRAPLGAGSRWPEEADDAFNPGTVRRNERHIDAFGKRIAVRFNGAPGKPRHAVMLIDLTGANNFGAWAPCSDFGNVSEEFTHARRMDCGVGVGRTARPDGEKKL